MIQRLLISSNSVIFVSTVIVELVGFGFIARARAGYQYDWVVNTGIEWIIIFVYVVFFLVLPFMNLVALLLKDRRFLIGS
jgi:uncharacterized membrane protein YtjA (UPF0391 family)